MRFIIGLLFFIALALNVQAQQTGPCSVCKVGQICTHSQWLCNICKTRYRAGGNSPTCPNLTCRSTTGQWRDTNYWGLPQQPQTTPQWPQNGGGNQQNGGWNGQPQPQWHQPIVKPTIKSGKGNTAWDKRPH